MSDVKHADTPWAIVRLTPSRVRTPEGDFSIDWSDNSEENTRNQIAQATAAFIVKSGNSHEILVEALKKIRDTDLIEIALDTYLPARIAAAVIASLGEA